MVDGRHASLLCCQPQLATPSFGDVTAGLPQTVYWLVWSGEVFGHS